MKMNRHTIFEFKASDSRYPSRLKEIVNRPRRVFVKGSVEVLGSPCLAIVGTRKATALGLRAAEEFSYELARLGFTIVSGLAMGIDAAAHRGALKAEGKSIAVLGCGLDKIFPTQNERLAEEIIDLGGALVSEYPVGTPAYQSNFLERNRITAGLSIATTIMEAPYRSGAINTASWSANQGKPVFVLPGPFNHPNYSGSHLLIRDGATLITSYKDLLEDLGLEIDILDKPKTGNKMPAKNLHYLIQKSGKPITIDELSRLTGKSISDLSTEISLLIIEDKIYETSTGFLAK